MKPSAMIPRFVLLRLFLTIVAFVIPDGLVDVVLAEDSVQTKGTVAHASRSTSTGD